MQLAGPSRQVGCCGAHSEPKASGAQGRALTHISSQAGSISAALYHCAVLPVDSLIDRVLVL